MNVLETLHQDSNPIYKFSPGAWNGAFQYSKFILNKYIKYLSFIFNSSSGTICFSMAKNIAAQA